MDCVLCTYLPVAFLKSQSTTGRNEYTHGHRIMQHIPTSSNAAELNVREVGALSIKILKGIQCIIQFIRERECTFFSRIKSTTLLTTASTCVEINSWYIQIYQKIRFYSVFK